MYYTMEIAGVKRNLELFPINETTCIAAFIMFGDVEITQAAAAKLLERAPEFDIIFTAEAKSIPLAYARASVAFCAPLRSTSCRSCFTCCRARCRS